MVLAKLAPKLARVDWGFSRGLKYAAAGIALCVRRTSHAVAYHAKMSLSNDDP